jgi:hypothetical protein
VDGTTTQKKINRKRTDLSVALIDKSVVATDFVTTDFSVKVFSTAQQNFEMNHPIKSSSIHNQPNG